MATKKTTAPVETLQDEKTPVVNNWSKKESIMIPRIPGQKVQDDVIVTVGGRTFQIQRGIRVEVPYPVARVIQNKLDFEMEAEDFYYNSSKD